MNKAYYTKFTAAAQSIRKAFSLYVYGPRRAREVYENIFVAYSPLHVLTAQSIVKEYGLTSCLLWVPVGYFDLLHSEMPMLTYHRGGSEKTKVEKLWRFFLSFVFIRSTRCVHLYIPNDADPFSMLIKKRTKFEYLHYIDEGITYLSRLLENYDASARSSTSILKKFFRLDNYQRCFSSPEFVSAFVFFPDMLKKESENVKFYSLSELFARHASDLIVDGGVSIGKHEIVILTQPLTADGHCDGYQEVSVIKEFVRFHHSKSILVKLHYRDDIHNYEFLRNESNVTILKGYDWVPYQAIHSLIQPRMLCSFISSVLFSAEGSRPDFKRVSLIDRIESPRAHLYESSMGSFKRYYDDFFFSKEIRKLPLTVHRS